MAGDISKGSGLLLGLSNDKEAGTKLNPMDRNTDGYRTLWIRQSGGGLVSTEKQDHIVDPYKDEFWMLENNTFNFSEKNDKPVENGDIYTCYNFNYNFKNIISHPAGKKSTDLFTIESFKKKYLEEEGDMGKIFKAGVEWLTYAGNNYACIMDYYYQTGGGSYRSAYNDIKLYNIESLGNINSRSSNVKLIDLLDEKEKDKLKEYAPKYNKTIYKDMISEEKLLADIDILFLKRKNGSWTVQVPLFYKFNHYGNGSSWYYLTEYVECDIKLPGAITSHDTLCLDWNTIRQKIPQAKDAVSSPEKDMLAVLTPEELLIFLDPEKGINKPALKIAVDNNESIILNQWATGSYVAKWDKIISTLT